MPLTRRTLLVASAVAVLVAGLAFPLGMLPDSGPGLRSGLVLEIQTVQRDLHHQLAATMQAARAERATAASAPIPDRAARLVVALDLVAVSGALVILIAGLCMLQAALTVPAHPLR